MKKIIGVLLVIIALILGVAWYTFDTAKTVEGTVTDKYVKTEHNNSKFYIVLDDNVVIENTDTILRVKYNSADIQARMHKGDHVEFKIYGVRNNLMSLYPNVYEVVD